MTIEVEEGNNAAVLGLEEDGRCPTPLKRSIRFDARAMLHQIKRVMKTFGIDLDADNHRNA